MAPKTIVLKGSGIRKEAAAAAGITPGHLVAVNSAGKFAVHGVAAGTVSPLFAVENELAGKGITVAYVTNEQVHAEYLVSGCEVYALVAASAAAIVIGDLLESAGDGTVRKHVPPANLSAAAPKYNSVVGRALQAVDNSAGGTPVRLIMEVL